MSLSRHIASPAGLLLSALLVGALPAAAQQTDTFYGWSKDSTWFAYQTVSGPNDLTELFLCATDDAIAPSWPKDLNEVPRFEEQKHCVRFTDPNRAPYGWKVGLAVPKSSLKLGKLQVLPELVNDGEEPGFVVQQVEKKETKKTVCPVSGLRESSKMTAVYWSPNGRFVAAVIDAAFHPCFIPFAPAPPAAKAPKRK